MGEIEVFVKLIKSGKLQLKAYNRANTDMTYDTAPYKQGLGFSYRESFNSFSDLFRPKRDKNSRKLKPVQIDPAINEKQTEVKTESR